MAIHRLCEADGKMDHLSFPALCKELFDVVVALHFGPRHLSMKAICYELHCNLYSVYCAIHPGHEQRIAEAQSKVTTRYTKGTKPTLESIIKSHPGISDSELIHDYKYSYSHIQLIRRKMRDALK